MRIAICTPLHGDPKAEFTTSLVQLVAATYETWPDDRGPIEIRYLTASGSNLPGNREKLVDMAIEAGADWILWADSDHSFPRDSLMALLAAGQPIVGTNYPRRSGDHEPVAAIYDENGQAQLVWTTEEKVRDKILEEVSFTGFGLLLMSVDSIRDLRPLFTAETGFGMSNEDAVACHKIRAAGHHIFVHHPLSWQIGHVATQVLTNAQAIALRQRRDMARQARERAASRRRS